MGWSRARYPVLPSDTSAHPALFGWGLAGPVLQHGLVLGDSGTSAHWISHVSMRRRGGRCLRLHHRDKELGQVSPFQGGRTGLAGLSCVHFAFLYVSSKNIEGSCHSIHPFQNERMNKASPSPSFLIPQSGK